MSKQVRIGTRRSPLALWQAEHVRSLLLARDPSLDVKLVELVTRGDVIVDRPLASVGGKGLFVKEIEEALLRGEVDIAVHSMKDLPAKLPDGLIIGCVPEREDPSDALCSPQFRTLAALPEKARVGTSSLRRACQLLAVRPDVQVVSIRGNVETRLRKLETEGLAAVVLARAGLKRLGLEARITEVLGADQMLSAVGQGALAIEVRESDAETLARVRAFEHASTRHAVDAERAFLDVLEGNCQVPLAAFAQEEAGGLLYLRGLVGRPDGKRVLREQGRAPVTDATSLGRAVAEALLEQGADKILSGGGEES